MGFGVFDFLLLDFCFYFAGLFGCFAWLSGVLPDFRIVTVCLILWWFRGLAWSLLPSYISEIVFGFEVLLDLVIAKPV